MSNAPDSTNRTVIQSTEDRQRSLDRSLPTKPPAEVPGYQIQHRLGAGAFGTVWLAIQQSTGKRVAIKFYEHRRGLDWPLLNREVEKLAFLYTERDIVQLIDVGWDNDPPYYVMEYLERGSLEEVLRDGAVPCDSAVRIATEVAQALVHAHGRGILHCDLKPANVLLDNDWKIRLADFGQSRLSHEQVPALGTLFYMAPEQADLKASPDARWDVYALGALLYHSLTGNPPHRSAEIEHHLEQAERLEEKLDRYRTAILALGVPTDHRRVAGCDRALSEILESCLEPDPQRRYPNAQVVLDALLRRSRHQAQRPMLALGLIAPLILLIVTVVLGVFGWRAAVNQSEQSLVEAVQAGNVYAAQGVASMVMLRMKELAGAVARTADDPELGRLLQGGDRAALGEFVSRKHGEFNRMKDGDGGAAEFYSLVVMTPDGKLLVRSPHSEHVIGRDFSWRDYYCGAIDRFDQPSRVYISKVFRSEADGKYMFSISAAIQSPEDPAKLLGILAATHTTGALPIRDNRRTAVLVGKWDSNVRPGLPTPKKVPDNLILLHPAYKPGEQAMELDNDILETVQGSGEVADKDDFYLDPLGRANARYAGRWLAGFAPVRRSDLATEFVVIVQQPFEEAVNPLKNLASTLAWRGWGALTIGVLLMAALWYSVQRAIQIENTRRRLRD